MIARTYHPQAPLANFVACFWYYAGEAPTYSTERILPDGSMEVVINLSKYPLRVYDGQNRQCWHDFAQGLVLGARDENLLIDTASQVALIGIHFRPGGAFAFLGRPADELHNEHVSIDTIWGRCAIDLHEQLLAADSPDAMFDLLTSFLTTRLATPHQHPVVDLALKAFLGDPRSQKVSTVAEQIGVSRKYFGQLFRAATGLTPKVFHRVQRFQQIVQMLEAEDEIEWADVALRCGYFDQAHFVHDFKAFSGLSPTVYLAQKAGRFNHVPLVD